MNLLPSIPALYKPFSAGHTMRIQKTALVVSVVVGCALAVFAENKPKLTLDDFFNSVSFNSIEMSPDGKSVVIGTDRADWDQQRFRTDLWLYHADSKDASPIQLTQSGHDSEPKWSPDGRWIAFLSQRKTSSGKDEDAEDDDRKDEATSQIYLISPAGGEAFPLTQGEEEVHAFSWSADSQTIYYATRQPWSKAQKDDYRNQWKDVKQYRTAERGDVIFALEMSFALGRHASAPTKETSKSEKEEGEDLTPGARAIAATPLRVDKLLAAPDGRRLAFLSNAVNQRQERYDDVELYTLDLTNMPRASSSTSASGAGAAAQPNLIEPHRITRNQAVETQPLWANDSRHIFFTVEIGDVSGRYRDLQPHLYWVDTEDGTVEQWAKDFIGPIEHYAVAAESVLSSARLGTEVQIYSANHASASQHRLSTWPGTYQQFSLAERSPRVAFVYSSLSQPDEVYLAESIEKLDQSRPITSFNKKLADADLPRGEPYNWKADDGTTVEGMLIYPPGKFEQKHLPMFTLIHGGPADADGNHFGADWYDWAALAATDGWLVFRPNYRGSTGYGDKFLMQIVPQIVSRPGKDILEGVDALVKDGIADPDRLTIGGYSYGGYMTNWLITQTTRFQAAVTGAGAVEHVGNWGNDDTTYDDAYFLGGRPWEAQQRYHDEAAIFQIDKVKTPTHMVAGADDIRVAVLEDYLLEHALYSLGIPNKLLVFPGEGHSLSKNPWHGKIKVREELKWLEKYGGGPAGN
jgi:dipeptidyl aminopeptidase/acylaminoacyl peptidase